MKPNPHNRNKLSQIAASKIGARLFRMSVGLFWSGNAQKFDREKEITVYPGDVLIRKGRPVRVGIEGMGDECGFVTQTVTPDMIGQNIARFLSVEDKTGTGRATKEQKAWRDMVRSFGGYAGVARSDEDVERICRGDIVD